MGKLFKRLEREERKRATKSAAAIRMSMLSDNEIASLVKKSSDSALDTDEWRLLRKRVLSTYGYRCMCCGAEPKDRRKINVDHIKPRKLFPELTYEFENLQVLCGRCNKAKGNKHFTDYRSAPVPT